MSKKNNSKKSNVKSSKSNKHNVKSSKHATKMNAVCMAVQRVVDKYVNRRISRHKRILGFECVVRGSKIQARNRLDTISFNNARDAEKWGKSITPDDMKMFMARLD